MQQPQHQRSLWLGALISPLVVPLTVSIHVLVRDFLLGPIGVPSLNFVIDLIVAVARSFLPFSYIVTFAFVLPVAFWLRAKDALSSVRLYAWCTILGPLIGITLMGYFGMAKGELLMTITWRSFFKDILGVAFSGLFLGIVFCLISRIRLLVR